jgi:hypothetical protein
MSIVAKKDYPDGYPADALEILRTMSFTNGKSVNIVGSMSLRSQIYAGDYDADEVVLTHGIRDLAVKDLVRKFKKILRDLQRLPNTYVGDIKSGSVEEWVIVHEPYSYEKSIKQLAKLYKEKIIDDKLYRDGLRRFKLNPSKLELLRLRRDFRPNVIRWTVREAVVGYKRLQDGRKFTLEEAFQKTAAGGKFVLQVSNELNPVLSRSARNFEDMYGISVFEVELISVKAGLPGKEEPQMQVPEGMQ